MTRRTARSVALTEGIVDPAPDGGIPAEWPSDPYD